MRRNYCIELIFPQGFLQLIYQLYSPLFVKEIVTKVTNFYWIWEFAFAATIFNSELCQLQERGTDMSH